MAKFLSILIILCALNLNAIANEDCNIYGKKVQAAFGESNNEKVLTLTEQKIIRTLSCDSIQNTQLLFLRIRAQMREFGFEKGCSELQANWQYFIHQPTLLYDLYYYLAKTHYDQERYEKTIQFLNEKIQWESLPKIVDLDLYGHLVILKGISLRKLGRVEEARQLFETTLRKVPEGLEAHEMLRQNLSVTYENLYLLDSLYDLRMYQLRTAASEKDEVTSLTMSALSQSGLSLIAERLGLLPKAIYLKRKALINSQKANDNYLTPHLFHSLFFLHLKNKDINHAATVLDSLEFGINNETFNLPSYTLPWLKSELNLVKSPNDIALNEIEKIIENWEEQGTSIHTYAFVLIHYLELLIYQKADCLAIQKITSEIEEISHQTGNLEIGYSLYQHFDKIKHCLQQSDYIYFLKNNEKIEQKIKQVQAKLLNEDFAVLSSKKLPTSVSSPLLYLIGATVIILLVSIILLFQKRQHRNTSNQQDFVKSLEHDLTKPLKNLVAQSQSNGNNDLETATLQKAVENIRLNIRRYAQLFDIENESITKANLHIKQLAHDIIEEFMVSSFTAIQIDDELQVETDILLLRQVFYNLIDNAIRFSKQPNQPEIVIKGMVKDSFVTIEISDKGIGFDANKFTDQLYQKGQIFHQNNVATNSGMGLYIVKKIMKRLGGTVHIISKENVGTTVTLNLPK